MAARRLSVIVIALLSAVSCSRNPEVVKRKYLESGNRYFERKQYKEASIMYRQALRKDPRYGEAYYRLGLTQLHLARIPEAVRSLRRAVELLPDRTEPKVELGNIFLTALAVTPTSNTQQVGNLQKEIKLLAEQLPQNSPHRHRFLGFYHLSQMQVKPAIEEFRQAHALAAFRPEFTLPLIQSLLADGQTAEAEKLARGLIQREKTFLPAYDVLYLHYARSNREAEAESLLKEKAANNPKEGRVWLQLAGHYHRLKRVAEMQAALEHLTGNLKDFPEAYRWVGDFYRARRDFDNAVRYYELGMERDSGRRLLYQRLKAQALIDQGRRAEAASLLDEVLKQNPKDEDARAMRAALTIETGTPEQLRRAVSELQAAITRSPDNAVLRYHLGRALVREGQLDQAAAQFQEAIKRQPAYLAPRLALIEIQLFKRDFPTALQQVREVLQLDPANLMAKLLRTGALVGLGNFAQARADLEATLKEHPESWEARLQMGALNLHERRFKEAEDIFSKLHQSGPPGDLRALMGLSETYAAQGRFDKSIALLKAELARAPDRPTLHLALANDYVRSGQYDAAIAEYQSLIQRNPKAGDLYLRLGETQRLKGDLNAAAASFRKAAELRPSDPQAHLVLALILDQQKQTDQALQVYEKILQIQPDHPVALNNLAYLLTERGTDLDRALTLALRARQKLPQDPNVADTVGWIYIKKNLSDNAAEIFRDLVRRYPNNPTFHYHLGMALYQKGDRAGARQALQTALRNKPSPEEAGKIKELLSRVG